MKFQDATAAEIDAVMNAAWEAFPTFRETTVKQRADLMRRIATEIGSEDEPHPDRHARKPISPRPGFETNSPGPNFN